MAKLHNFSGKELCTLFMKHGFVLVRQRGSHMIMQKRFEDGTITVPIPNHSEIRTGTLHSIVRQSKIDRMFFE